MLYKLSDVFDLQMGKTPSRDNNMYWKDGNLPWVSIADLSKSQIYIENSKEMITNLAAKDTLMKCIPQDTVIMSFKLSLGKTAITKTPLYTNEAIMAFIDKKVIQIEPKYIYFLFCNIKWGQYTNNAVKGKTLNKKFFSDFQIYIPEYTQQTKIASILIRINKILEYKHSLIKAYDAIIKSRFVEMFGDPNASRTKYKLVPIHMVTDCMVPGRDKPKSFTGEIPWITINDLNVNGYTNKSKLGLGLTIDEVKEVNRKCVPQGSVLMSCVGNLGLCSIASVDVVINQQLHSYQCNEFINNLYLMYYLSFKNTYMNKIASSTTVLYMNKNACNNIPVLLPPIDLQISFAKYLNQINKLKSDVQKSIDETQLLMDSLMQEYFG